MELEKKSALSSIAINWPFKILVLTEKSLELKLAALNLPIF